MRKIYSILIGALMLLPFVAAADNPHGFDLYYLLVENVFGGPFYATLGMLAIFILFGLLSRMSFTAIFMLTGLFVMTSLIGFIGMGAVFLFGLISIWYFASGLIKWWLGWNT